MAEIEHPIKLGTKVKYLTPKCPCLGKGYLLKQGKVVAAIAKDGKFFYNITTSKHRIPELGITEVL
jgi:hypothetical protein